MDSYRFINDVIKPWDELSTLLSQRLALQPELSDVTRLAGGLAVAIRHQVDVTGIRDATANTESNEHRIIADAADFWKHGSLRNSSRNNGFSAEAFFEYEPDKGFSFIRNALFVEHASLGKHDFLHASLGAIEYWIRKRSLGIAWQGIVRENPAEFHPVAYLYFGAGRNIMLENTRLGFFSKNQVGRLERVRPPNVKFAILDKKKRQVC